MAKVRINKGLNSEGRAIGRPFLAVPEEWRTPKVSFAAVSARDGYDEPFSAVSGAYKTPEFCLAVVEQRGAALEFVPETLKTPTLCRIAVEQDEAALAFVPENLKAQTAPFAEEAKRRKQDAEQKKNERQKAHSEASHAQFAAKKKALRAPWADVLEATANAESAIPPGFPYELENVPKEKLTTEICLGYVKRSGSNLQKVPKKWITREMCIMVILNDSRAAQYIPEKCMTPEFLNMLLDMAPGANMLEMRVPEKYRSVEVCLAALRHPGIRHNPDAQLTLAAMSINNAIKTEVAELDKKDRPDFYEWIKTSSMTNIGGNARLEIPHFDRAIELNGSCAGYYYERALCYYAVEEYEKAISDINRAVELFEEDDPYEFTSFSDDNDNWYLLRARCFAGMGKTAEAAADYTTVNDYFLKGNSPWNTALRERGLCYLAMGDRERALADFTAAIQNSWRGVYSEDSAYYWRGRLFLETGDVERALSDLTMAVVLEPRFRKYQEWLDKARNFTGSVPAGMLVCAGDEWFGAMDPDTHKFDEGYYGCRDTHDGEWNITNKQIEEAALHWKSGAFSAWAYTCPADEKAGAKDYASARALFDKKQYPEALEAVSRAIEQHSRNAGYRRLRANIYDAQGRYPGALADGLIATCLERQKQRIGYEPQIPLSGWCWVGAATAGDYCYQHGEPRHAADAWTSVLGLMEFCLSYDDDSSAARNMADAYYKRALSREMLKEFDAALEDYSSALKMNSDESYGRGRVNRYFILLVRANCWLSLNKPELALEDRKNADAELAEMPEHQRSEITKRRKMEGQFAGRAGSCLTNRKYSEAAENFSLAIYERGGTAMLYLRRAQAWDALEKPDLAEIDNAKAAAMGAPPPTKTAKAGIAVSPDIKKAADELRQTGNAFNSNGEYEKAIEAYTSAINLDGENSVNYNQRGNAYLNMENYEAALADYTKAANLNSSNPIYWKQRGQAYHNLGQHSLAAADLTKAIVLDENYAAAYWRRGEAYMALGDRDAAIADLTRALPLLPESAKDARVEIKALLEKAKQNAAAKAAPGKNRFCGNCGKELQPDQKFCPECGTRA